MPLNAKQKAFVAEYLIDLNATQAAIRAGYSKKTADRIGPELLGKTCVAEAVAKAQAERAEKAGRTALDVLKDIQDVTRDARDGGDCRTALRGLELEGKHLGMFVEKVEATHKGRVEIEHELSPGVAALIDRINAAREGK